MVLNTVKQDDVTLKEDFTSNTVVEVDDSNTDDTDTGGNSFNPNDNIDSDLTPEEIAQVLQGDGITISNVRRSELLVEDCLKILALTLE